MAEVKETFEFFTLSHLNFEFLIRYLATKLCKDLEEVTSGDCATYFQQHNIYPPTCDWPLEGVVSEEDVEDLVACFGDNEGSETDEEEDHHDEFDQTVKLVMKKKEGTTPMKALFRKTDGYDLTVITYSWRTPLTKVAERLAPCMHFDNPIWIDIFMVNQNSKNIIQDIQLAQQIYATAEDHRCVGLEPLSRTWCLFEFFIRRTKASRVEDNETGFSTTKEDLPALKEYLDHFDDIYHNMQATKEEDKKSIQEVILQSVTQKQFNRLIKNLLIIHYNAEDYFKDLDGHDGRFSPFYKKDLLNVELPLKLEPFKGRTTEDGLIFFD